MNEKKDDDDDEEKKIECKKGDSSTLIIFFEHFSTLKSLRLLYLMLNRHSVLHQQKSKKLDKPV